MKNTFIISIICIILGACSTQNISIDYDRSQNFSAFKTYQLDFQNSSLGDLDLERFKSALNSGLSQKGMTENNSPDLVISIVSSEHISKERNSNVGVGLGSFGRGIGTSIGFGIPINSSKLNQTYRLIMQTPDGKMVWEGLLEIVSPANPSPETREANIQKGVQKLLKKYPPQS